MVFHFERLFRRSHPKVPNPAGYQQIRRGDSVYSQSSVFEEIPQNEEQQPEQPAPQQQQQRNRQQQQLEQQRAAPLSHSEIVQVHQAEDSIANKFP